MAEEPVLLQGAGTLFELVPRVRWETDFERLASLRRLAAGARVERESEDNKEPGNRKGPSSILELPKIASRWLRYAAAGVAKIGDGFVVSRTLSPGMLRAMERVAAPPWKLATSADNELLALLGDDRLEIVRRATNFDFGRTKSSIELDFDPFRGWRKIAWSHDANLVAIAGSDGAVDIVTATGHWLATILNEMPTESGEMPSKARRRHYVDSLPNAGATGNVGILDPIAVVQFVDPSIRKSPKGKDVQDDDAPTAPNELLVIGFDGILRSYLIDATRVVVPPTNQDFDQPPESLVTIFQEGADDAMGIVRFSHTFSFRPFHSVVASAYFDRTTNVLTICGRAASGKKGGDKPQDDISFWKLTSSGDRYTKLGGASPESSTDASSTSSSSVTAILDRIGEVVSPRRTILDVDLSPDSKLLATVGIAGELRIWSYATGRCVREYEPEETALMLADLPEDSLNQLLTLRRVDALDDEEEEELDGSEAGSDVADEWSDTDGIDDLLGKKRRTTRSMTMTSVSSVTSAATRIVSVAEAQPSAIGDEDGRPLPLLVSARWWSNQVLVLAFSTGHTVLFDIFAENERDKALLNLRFPTAPAILVQPGDAIYVLYQDASTEEPTDSDLPGLSTIVTAPFQLITNLILWDWRNEDTLIPPQGHQPRPPRFNFSSINVTTPQQALQSRIRHGQYVAALDLCLAFELDTDPVFKAQFESSEITPHSIETVLSKVRDDYFVLEACVNKVPDDPEACRALLEFGLRKTGLEDDMEVEEVLGLLENEAERLNNGDDFGNDMLMVDLCRYRADLLGYMDRLRTFELIGPSRKSAAHHRHHSERDKLARVSSTGTDLGLVGIRRMTSKPQGRQWTNFASSFTRFRDRNLLIECLERAIRGDFFAVQILFTRHGNECLPFRFGILEQIPEIIEPSQYALLLPRIARDGSEERWNEELWRPEPDWAEDKRIAAFMDGARDSVQPEPPVPAVSYPTTGQVVRDWYVSRVRTVDKLSGLERNALQLVELALDECGVQGVEVELVRENLKTLCELLYGILPPQATEMRKLNLGNLEAMEPMEVVRLMLANVDAESVVSTIRGVLNYPAKVVRQHWEDLGKVAEPKAMVRTWLRERTADTGISLCCEVIEAALPWSKEQGGPLDIGTNQELTELILDCCYIYPAADEASLGYMNRMFDCLPEIQNMDRVVTSTSPLDGRQMLHEGDEIEGPYAERVREFDKHLVCCEILAKLDVPTPLLSLSSYEANEEVQSSLIKKLARRAGAASKAKKSPRPGLDEDEEDAETMRVEKLVADLLVLRDLGVLGKLSTQRIYQEVISSVLNAGEFATAKRLLTDKAHPIPDSVAEDLVVAAAVEFFDNAESGDRTEGGLKMAEECLEILPSTTPRVGKEMDLILATDELYRYKVSLKPGLDILPIQVRLSENRLNLVSRRIKVDKNSPYRADRILLLAHRLGFKGDRMAEVRVQAMLVDAAIDNSDYNKAYELCSAMIKDMREAQMEFSTVRKEIWSVCYRLASEERFVNIDARLEIVGIAIAVSPEQKLAELLDTHSRLEEMLRVEELSAPARTAVFGLRRGSDVTPPVIWRRGGASGFVASKAWEDIEATLDLLPTDLSGEDDFVDGVAKSDASREPPTLGQHQTRRNLAYGFHRDDAPPDLREISDLPKDQQAASLRLASYAVLLKLAESSSMPSDKLDSVLSESAFNFLAFDTARAISLLMDSSKDDAAKEVFDKLYPSSFNEHLALYYYSLWCLNELAQAGGVDLDPRVCTPFEVMRFIGSILGDPQWERALAAAEDSGDVKYVHARKAVANVREAAKTLRSKREDQLLEIACERFQLSRRKFETDESYRMQSIVDIMGSPEPQWMANALFLAATWNVSKEQAVLAYVSWLFLRSNLVADQIDNRLRHANEAIVDCGGAIGPDICDLHKSIPGDALATLSAYYRFVRSLASSVPALETGSLGQAAEQLENRESIISDLLDVEGIRNFDFRDLIKAIYADEDGLVAMLEDMSRNLLSTEPVVAIMPNVVDLRALSIFPDEAETAKEQPTDMDLAHIVSMFTLKHVDVLLGQALKARTPKEQDLKYGACARLLGDMMSSEILHFVRLHCVGREALAIPLKYRLSFATEAAGIFGEREADESDEAVEVTSINQHVKNVMEIASLKDPSTGAVPSQELVEAIDLAFDDPQARFAKCEEMVESKQSPYLVHRVATCVAKMPKTDATLASKLDTASLYCEALKRAAKTDSEQSLSHLSEIVTSVITYETPSDQPAAEYQWLAILEDSMLTTLRSLSGDASIDSARRRSIMAIINRDFVLKEEEMTELRAIKVQETIRDAFGKEIALADLEKTEKRLQVFLSILETLEEDEADKIAALRSMLDEFTQEAIETGAEELPAYLHACWGYLLKWLVGRNLDAVAYDILLSARQVALVNEEEEQEVLSILLADRPDPMPYLTTGLVSYHDTTLTQITNHLSTLESNPSVDGNRLLHILLALRGLLGLAPSTLREKACDSLLRVPRGSNPGPYRALLRHAVAALVEKGDYSLSARLAAGFFGSQAKGDSGIFGATGIRARLALISRMLAGEQPQSAVQASSSVSAPADRSPRELEERTISALLPSAADADALVSRARARLNSLRESWT